MLISLEPELAHLRAALDLARVGRDPEGVHQVRVASRRLGVFLRLRGQRALGDDLRWLRTQAGSLRDIDVLLDQELPPPLATWLAEERRLARASLGAALTSARLAALLAALALQPPVPRAVARAHLPGLARAALVRGAALESSPASPLALHALRRALRRLRYGAEWLRLPVDELRASQERLGAVNDLALLLRHVHACPQARGLADWGAGKKAELEGLRQQARAAWPRIRSAVEALR